MTAGKTLLRALASETLPTPPVWLMRQAGRYLPEYRATRTQAGSFLDLCYRPDLATEVTLQPIRRFGFDAAILFADILLLPQALGRRLWFEEGEGPRLEPFQSEVDLASLADDDAMHAALAPVYETVARLKSELPAETALIGFAGAPWTVATYVVAGRGKDGQAGALRMMAEQPALFAALMERLTEATAAYLIRQIDAGAEVVKLFDSWAGALGQNPAAFRRWCLEPTRAIVAAVRAARPGTPVIVFPRSAGAHYAGFAPAVGAQGLAIDEAVSADWAREALQPETTVQGNLDPIHLVRGGQGLVDATHALLDTLGGGPYVFNLGHGITPDADPRNVELLLRTIRS